MRNGNNGKIIHDLFSRIFMTLESRPTTSGNLGPPFADFPLAYRRVGPDPNYDFRLERASHPDEPV